MLVTVVVVVLLVVVVAATLLLQLSSLLLLLLQLPQPFDLVNTSIATITLFSNTQFVSTTQSMKSNLSENTSFLAQAAVQTSVLIAKEREHLKMFVISRISCVCKLRRSSMIKII